MKKTLILAAAAACALVATQASAFVTESPGWGGAGYSGVGKSKQKNDHWPSRHHPDKDNGPAQKHSTFETKVCPAGGGGYVVRADKPCPAVHSNGLD